MQFSKLSLVACLAGLASLPVLSQSTTPEQQKALELLNQTIAQDRQAGSKPPTDAPVKQPSQTLAQPAPVLTQPASPQEEQRALELLRQKIQEEQSAANQAPAPNANAKPKPARTSSTKKSSKPPGTASSSTTMQAAGSGSVTNTPAMPSPSAGPKTKQERLMELLQLYQADKISPAEYHDRRAKILAEP